MTASVPDLELLPPEISALRAGNTGVDYVTTFDSGVDGPHLVINGLTHGNELCGAIAISFLFGLGIHPARGRLTLVLANVASFQNFDPARPHAARYLDEDFNRLWALENLDGGGDSVELRRARQLRRIYDQADVLLDLHSMQNPTDPLILSGRTARGVAVARKIGCPRWIVSDHGHAAGRRLIEYGDFGEADGRRAAVIVECGQHWLKPAAAMAIEVSLRFLIGYGLIERDRVAPWLAPEPLPEQALIEVTEAVTASSDDFVYASDFIGMEVVPAAGTLIGFDEDREIRTPYDDCILIMPSRRLKRGQTVVRFGRRAAGTAAMGRPISARCR